MAVRSTGERSLDETIQAIRNLQFHPLEIEEERRKQILRQRAAELAGRAKAEPDAGSFLEVLVFGLGGERYAVDTSFVTEIHPLRGLTRIPLCPPFVRGAAAVRGRIVSVVDIKQLLHFPDGGLTERDKIIVLRNDREEMAILAEELFGLEFIDRDAIDSSIGSLPGVDVEFFEGIGAGGVVLLDAGLILEDTRLHGSGARAILR